MKNGFILAAKLVALWIALLIGQIVSGLAIVAMVHGPMPVPVADGPLSVAFAMPVIAAAFAVVLASLAANMRWTTWGKAVALFVILYTLESLLSLIEAWYFNAYVKMPMSLLGGLAVGNGLKAAIAAVVGALLWPAREVTPGDRLTGLAWKLPLIVPIYILVYFGAGALIAWQGAAVRTYYAQGLHINNGELALLQVLRGAIWAGVALLIVTSIRGSVWLRAALTGVAFSVFMGLVLLLPNTFMPWPVRQMHLMEICSSNLLFGIVAALILMAGKKPASPTASLPGAARP